MKADARAGELQDFHRIESRLRYSLRPVAPRQEFVQELQQQLYQQYRLLPALTKFSLSYVIWIGLTIILAFMMIFGLGMRLLVFIVAIVSLLNKPNRKSIPS